MLVLHRKLGERVILPQCRLSFTILRFCCGSDFGAVEGRTGLNKKDASLSFG